MGSGFFACMHQDGCSSFFFFFFFFLYITNLTALTFGALSIAYLAVLRFLYFVSPVFFCQPNLIVVPRVVGQNCP